jgi:hemerythrin superfamily protein
MVERDCPAFESGTTLSAGSKSQENLMARSKTRAKKKSTRKPARRASPRSSGRPTDAIALLKADHRQVEQWFEQFEKTRSDERKLDLAQNICKALTVHTQIEEEIFYPAFLEATKDKDMHHEAEIEHDGAKKLIAAIEGSSPDDDYYDSRVKVLSEMIKHHVKEEEQRDGMFAEARDSGMDLVALGEQMAARKAELMGGEDTGSRRGSSRAVRNTSARANRVAEQASRH